jgi:hypothetical protein
VLWIEIKEVPSSSPRAASELLDDTDRVDINKVVQIAQRQHEELLSKFEHHTIHRAFACRLD